MTDEQRRKVRNRVTYLSIASLVVLLAVLIVLGVTEWKRFFFRLQ